MERIEGMREALPQFDLLGDVLILVQITTTPHRAFDIPPLYSEGICEEPVYTSTAATSPGDTK